MKNPLKKEEKINTETYNVDRNENEQQNADHSSDGNQNEQRKKDIDLLSYQYDLLSQKVENKKLSLENKTLEEEKAALQKENKTLTSMNEQFVAEKKVLLRENESMSLENKRLQDENMRIKRELEMLIIRQNNKSTEEKRQLSRQISSLSGDVELQQSYSSHTKQLEETMKRILRCKLDQLQETSSKESTEKIDELSNTFRGRLQESADKLNADQKLLREKMEQIQEASRKESIERMEELETLFKEKLIETTQKLNADQDRLREKMDQLQEASSLKSAETMEELNSALDKKLTETAEMMRSDQEKLIVENVSWGKAEEEEICELMNEVTSTRLESIKHNAEDETHERAIVPEESNNALVLATVTPNKDINEIEAKDSKDDINDNNEKDSMSLNDALSECDTTSSGDVSEHGSLEDIIPEEKIFHIHDKQINHISICFSGRKRLLIAASGHIVKVTNVEDGKLLWTTADRGRRNVSCINTIEMTGSSVLACGYFGNNIDHGSSIDFICLRTFTTLASFACSSPVYVMSVCKPGGKDLLSCAYQSGLIDIFDMRSQRLLTTLPGTRENPIGFDKFILGRYFHLAVAGNVENYIDIWQIGRDESKVTLTIPVRCKKMNSLCTFTQDGQISIAVGTEDYTDKWNILIFKMNNYNAVRTIHSTCLKGLMYLKPVSINGVLKLASCCYLSDEIDFWEIDTLRRDRSNGIKSKDSLTCYSSSFSCGKFTLVAGSKNGSIIEYKILVDNRTKSSTSKRPRRRHSRSRGRRRSRGKKKPRVVISHGENTKHECPKTHLSSLLL